jgi:hypothetical protein
MFSVSLNCRIDSGIESKNVVMGIDAWSNFIEKFTQIYGIGMILESVGINYIFVSIIWIEYGKRSQRKEVCRDM